MNYNPLTFGQVLPGVVTIRVGLIMNEDHSKDWLKFYFDNFKFELWTEVNETGIIKTYDNEFAQNYTYYNDLENIGNGHSFIETERIRNPTGDIDFTIYNNMSDILDFYVGKITLTSFGIKTFNSTVSSKLGSLYTPGVNISWQVEFSISSIPDGYNSWVEFKKPSDWFFTSIIDGFEADRTGGCLGRGFGSNRLIIPNNIMEPGLWKLEAISNNYISNGTLRVWNGNAFVSTRKLTINELFQIDVTINETVSLADTQINCTILYPNSSIFWQTSKEPTSYNEKFGNFTVGKNMTIGNYIITIEWVNNISSIETDKVGYIELNFIVWHSTNLTAVDSDIEKIAGDPCLIKVNYTDYDLNTYITLATVTYNSTFGQSGNMIYIGSGTYFLDLDTSSLELGDYYFSFNASKIYYENQSANNLIHLKIVSQPLAIEVLGSAINAMGNNFAICNVNVTGALSGTPIWPANVTTDWSIWYNVTDNDDGTYTLNFSTNGIPTEGILQSYTINIFANKTNYGSTSNFITLIIHPVPTGISVNQSIHNVYLNEIFYVKINYSLEETGTIISGAIWEITWSSIYNVFTVADGYIVMFNTLGLSIDVHTALVKMEKAGYESEIIGITAIVGTQDVNLTVQINSAEISENSLIELTFKEKINISARTFAVGEEVYLSDSLITWISDNFEENLTESPLTYYNSSITMDGANFATGINYIYIRFQQENYTTRVFSFQLFISEQQVNLTIYINTIKISENTLIDLYFKEKINISARAFALAELEFLSGGIITWISDNFEKNLTESPSTYFNSSIIMDGAYFNPGLNYIYLRFQQANYTTKTFSFQLFIRTQTINLTLCINSQQVQENYLIEKYFNEQITLSCRAYAEVEQIYLSNCTMIFINGNYEHNLTEYVNYWYNDSIVISTTYFELGLNYVYIKFIRTNYSTTTFSFQIKVQQIKMDLETIDFDDSIEAYVGESIKIEIKLVEEFSNIPIEGAEISYEWEYGVGEFDDEGNGIYEVEIEIPENIELKNYKLELIISKSGGIYKTSEHEIIIDVNGREVPEYWIWILIAVLLGALGLLTALSLRAYVFLPRARKKERELLSKTQNFKDMKSIQALMLIHRLSGLPIYYKTFGFLEDTDAHLFSGFVQAITTIGTEIAKKESGDKFSKKKRIFAEHMMEIDFKYFYALIYDHRDLRIVFILIERSSESFREKIKDLSEKITIELKELLENFKGDLEPFEKILTPILYSLIDVYYKGPFKLAQDVKIEKAHTLKSMEKRMINVIRSSSKNGEDFLLKSVLKMTSEKNEDLIIEAIEGLIQKELLIPSSRNLGIIKGKKLK